MALCTNLGLKYWLCYTGVTASAFFAASAGAVSPDCTQPNILCVGPGQEFDTNITNQEQAFQGAVDSATPGDVIKIKAGHYSHNSESSRTTTFLTVRNSGTPEKPITIEPFDGENVLIEGFGYGEGLEGPSRRGEYLINVLGDHIHIRRLELAYSSRYGMRVAGSFGRFEDILVRDSWESNIILQGATRTVEDNQFRRIESVRSRHGTGFWAVPRSGSTPQVIRDTLVEDSLFYDNGYQPDGLLVPIFGDDDSPGMPGFGGGNSDGIGIWKGCVEFATEENPNLCPGTILKNNIAFHNADDGFDSSGGDGSAFIDNIAFNNGPQGNRSYKVYTAVDGSLSFTGNVGFGEPNISFEARFNHDGFMHHNTTLHNATRGFNVHFPNPDQYVNQFINNLSAFNQSSQDTRINTGAPGALISSNWDEESPTRRGDPALVNGSFKAFHVEPFDQSMSLTEKMAFIRSQVKAAFTPLPNSPLVDAGEFLEGVHCPRADDNPDNPMELDSDCRHWSGAAPDIGAFEYTGEVSPPVPTPSSTTMVSLRFETSLGSEYTEMVLDVDSPQSTLSAAQFGCRYNAASFNLELLQYGDFFDKESRLEEPAGSLNKGRTMYIWGTVQLSQNANPVSGQGTLAKARLGLTELSEGTSMTCNVRLYDENRRDVAYNGALVISY